MKKVFLMLVTLSLMFTSCNSDTMTSETTNQEATEIKATGATPAFKALRDKALAEINYGGKVFYDAKKGLVFNSKSKSSIVIPPFSLKTRDGKDITGPIEIDFIEIYNKAKMVVTNKPTMVQVSAQVKDLLVTGGEFYLDIKFNGQRVVLASPIKVNIDVANSQANPVGMALWNGAINSDDNLTWNAANPNDLTFENDGAIFGGRNGNMYDVLVNNSSNFGWCNIDRLAGLPGVKTKISVVPPAGFNHTNSSVYLAVKGENNMLAQFDMFNSGTNTFEEHYGLVPVGLDCHIIFVAEQNGNYVYYILSTAIGNNATYTVTTSNLITTTSYSQVEAAINALP